MLFDYDNVWTIRTGRLLKYTRNDICGNFNEQWTWRRRQILTPPTYHTFVHRSRVQDLHNLFELLGERAFILLIHPDKKEPSPMAAIVIIFYTDPKYEHDSNYTTLTAPATTFEWIWITEIITYCATMKNGFSKTRKSFISRNKKNHILNLKSDEFCMQTFIVYWTSLHFIITTMSKPRSFFLILKQHPLKSVP